MGSRYTMGSRDPIKGPGMGSGGVGTGSEARSSIPSSTYRAGDLGSGCPDWDLRIRDWDLGGQIFDTFIKSERIGIGIWASGDWDPGIRGLGSGDPGLG